MVVAFPDRSAAAAADGEHLPELSPPGCRPPFPTYSTAARTIPSSLGIQTDGRVRR